MSNRNVGTEIAALPRMEIKDLRSRYAEVFGEPTKSGNKQWLAKRIAWRLQSMAEGDLSERARKRAAELARDSDLRTTTPRVPVVPASAGRTIADNMPHDGDRRRRRIALDAGSGASALAPPLRRHGGRRAPGSANDIAKRKVPWRNCDRTHWPRACAAAPAVRCRTLIWTNLF